MKYKLLLVGLLTYNALPSIAHDNKVIHPTYLSEPAMELAVPIKDSSQPYYEIYRYFSPCSGPYCIRQGTIDEDIPSSRARNHFFNPKTGGALLPWPFDINARDYGKDLFQTAVSLYFGGKKEESYYMLGRALHLLQDMSSPGHIFLDQHIVEAEGWDWFNVVTGYESWVAGNIGNEPQSYLLGSGVIQPAVPSWENFIYQLANETYNRVRISGTLYMSETNPASGDLAVMFPPENNVISPMSYLAYVDMDWLGRTEYWKIAGVGSYSPFVLNNDWWEVGHGTDGYFYIESPQDAIPVSYKGNDNRTLQRNLAKLWVETDGLINLPINYSAGLMKYFYDLVNMPPYLKKVTLTQGDKVVYSGEWSDGPGSRTLALGVNEPITAATQLNMELEFSKPMQSASAYFEYATSLVEIKGGAFDDNHVKWTAYIDGPEVANISEGVQSLNVNGNDTGGRALDANPATVISRDSSGNFANYEDNQGATDTYTGGTDKTNKLTFKGTPPAVTVIGGNTICSGATGSPAEIFSGYSGNDFTFQVSDSTTGVKYFRLARAGEVLAEETLAEPIPFKSWVLNALGTGNYVLTARDALDNETVVQFNVETLDIELDKDSLSGTPLNLGGIPSIASARFGVKVNSSAGLKSVELRGPTGDPDFPVEATLSYEEKSGEKTFTAQYDAPSARGGIYRVVVKDLAGNGKTLNVSIGAVSGGIDSYCLNQLSCTSAEYDLWKIMLGYPSESTIPGDVGVMPGSAILYGAPAMDWTYTGSELPFQEVTKHNMGYVDIGVQSNEGGGAFPRVNYYEVAGENQCPQDALFSYNGCSGQTGCITPYYSRCGVGAPNVNIQVGRYAQFAHVAFNYGEPGLPLGMCPAPCYNIADNTCSCTQTLDVTGSVLSAGVFGVSYSTTVGIGVEVLPGTNVSVIAASGLEIVYDEVTQSAGGVSAYGIFEQAPAGYKRLAGYEIFNSVPFSGQATLKFDYDPAQATSAQAGLAKIYKVVTDGDTRSYQEVPTTVDPDAHKVSGRVSGFSKYIAVCPVQSDAALITSGETPSGSPVFSILSGRTPVVQAVAPTAPEISGATRGLLAGGLLAPEQIYSVADSTEVYLPYALVTVAYDAGTIASQNISVSALSLYAFDEAGNAVRLADITNDSAANTIMGRVYSPKKYYAILASTTPVPLPGVDGEAPATVAAYITPAYKPNPYVVYASSGVSVALDAYDLPADTSVAAGVAGTYYMVDPDSAAVAAGLGGATTQYYSLYSSTLSFEFQEGRHLLVYGSVDNNGLYEPLELESIYVDVTAPASSLVIEGSSAVINGVFYATESSSISLPAADALSNGVASGVKHVYYLVDKTMAECVSPPTFMDMPGTCDNPVYAEPFTLGAGVHSVYYLAEDNVGNLETFKTAAISVAAGLDATPPVTQLEFYGARETPGGTYLNAGTTVAISAFDPQPPGEFSSGVGTIYYLLDSDMAISTPAVYLHGFTLNEGTHTISYTSVDNFGNFDILRSSTVLVDATPPLPSLEIVGSSTTAGGLIYIDTLAGITINAIDPVSNGVASGILMRMLLIDISPDSCQGDPDFTGPVGTCSNPRYTGPFSLMVGTHTVYYTAMDNAGNMAGIKYALFDVSASSQTLLPITPSSGPIGVPFTIDGIGFGTYTAGTTVVLIGGTTAPLTLWSDMQIKGTIPGMLETGEKAVSVLRGSEVLATVAPFTVTQPVLYTLTPSSGPIGMPFVITGESFGNYVAGYTAVLIDGTTCPLTLWSDTQVKGTIPGTLSVGDHAVVVGRALNGGSVATSSAAFTVVSPAVAAVTPSSGSIGVPFTVTGSGFGNYVAGQTGVLINGTTCPLTLWTDTKIQGTVPGSLAPGDYQLIVGRAINGGEVGSQPVPFSVVPMEAYWLAPSSGPIGMPFTITGANFGNYSSAYTHVLIGDTTAPLTLWTDGKIQGTIPGGLASGQHPVLVERRTSDGGLMQTSPITFEVLNVDVASMTPVAGPIGLPFTIYGDNFGNYVANYTRVLIGGTTCPLTLWSADKIQGAIPGALAPGEYPVVVERELNGGIVQSSTLTFTVSVPVAYEITPSSGAIGLPFTINGESFGNYAAAYTGVLINGATVPLTLWTDTQIKGTIPGNLAPGQYPVLVGRMTADGGMVGSNALTFEVVGINVASMTPVAGPIGMPFTIDGGNFGNYSAGLTKVLIGGTTCPLTLWSDTQIKGTIPGSLAAGEYQLVVERNLNGGQVQSQPLAFNVTTPAMYTLTPSSGPIGLPFVITGENFGNYVANYTRVLIGGAAAPLTLWSTTTIKGTIPGSLAPGDYELYVERALNGGVVQSSTFSFTVGAPYLATVSPSTAAVIAPFTLTGYNFGNYVANYTKVLVNGTTTVLTLWTDTKIQGKLPFLLAGQYPVQVQRYLNGGLAESATAWINIEEPVISSMTPVSGTAGTVFNLYGTGFGPYDASIAHVTIGGAACALSLWSDTRITGTVPSELTYGTHTVVASRGQALSGPVEFYLTGGYTPSMMRLGSTPSALEFKLGEVYVYPDPAKGGKVPVFHIEVGTADSVKIKIFTVAGQLAKETTLTGSPQATGLTYAYEYAWTGHIASGVYYYTIEAERTGRKLKARGKFSVVR